MNQAYIVATMFQHSQHKTRINFSDQTLVRRYLNNFVTFRLFPSHRQHPLILNNNLREKNCPLRELLMCQREKEKEKRVTP
ncbi:CLUMA_CG010692, isoform A [Clunio marinus]|uniref:CLUMA_CG010692, isoform A n=1 Tax=Clunio marinus TaxID=568069 RepID=A0A1J1IFR5_9DIPT|nr:CLUMA_CG010692, isoform A [Clunio marinus]